MVTINEIVFGRTKQTRIFIASSIITGMLLLIINFLYFIDITIIFTTLNLLAAGIII